MVWDPPATAKAPNCLAKASLRATTLAPWRHRPSILHAAGAPGPSLAGSALARSKAMKNVGSCTAKLSPFASAGTGSAKVRVKLSDKAPSRCSSQ